MVTHTHRYQFHYFTAIFKDICWKSLTHSCAIHKHQSYKWPTASAHVVLVRSGHCKTLFLATSSFSQYILVYVNKCLLYCPLSITSLAITAPGNPKPNPKPNPYPTLTLILTLSDSDISVSKINSVSITVLCVTGYFTFLLYFYFGKHFRFSFSFQLSYHFYFSFTFSFYFRFRYSMLDTESIALIL